jgi:hypothetical protein
MELLGSLSVPCRAVASSTLPADAVTGPDLVDLDTYPRDVAGAEPAHQPLPLHNRLVQRPDLNLADRPAAEQSQQALDVVGAQVPKDQERHLPDAQHAHRRPGRSGDLNLGRTN